MEISKLQLNQTIIDQKFFLLEYETPKSKRGSTYLVATLGDGVRTIKGYYWDTFEKETLKSAKVLLISGVVSEWNGKYKIDISSFSVSNSAEDLKDLIPKISEKKLEYLKIQYATLKNNLDNEDRKLLEYVEKQIGDIYFEAPGASINHHAYIGGLAEHSITIALNSFAVSRNYVSVDKSLIILGALLHDIGKIWENDFKNYPFKKTKKGKLLNHIGIGLQFIGSACSHTKYQKRELLEHIIGSHHDLLEWGSLVTPMIPEAIIIAKLDYIDYFISKYDSIDSNDINESGFVYDKLLKKYLYFDKQGEKIARTS